MSLMFNTHRSQQGFGLIEVLVALLIIAIGLLGTIALQTRATQAELESYQRVQALILLEDMANRINANRAERSCYDLLGRRGFEFVGVGGGTVGTCDDRADDDLQAWDDLLRGAAVDMDGTGIGAMIGARGCIERLETRRYRISVAWQGMSETTAPPPELGCAQGQYGDETQRRVVSQVIEFAELGN